MKNIKLILKIAYTTGDRGMLNQIFITVKLTNRIELDMGSRSPKFFNILIFL